MKVSEEDNTEENERREREARTRVENARGTRGTATEAQATSERERERDKDWESKARTIIGKKRSKLKSSSSPQLNVTKGEADINCSYQLLRVPREPCMLWAIYLVQRTFDEGPYRGTVRQAERGS